MNNQILGPAMSIPSPDVEQLYHVQMFVPLDTPVIFVKNALGTVVILPAIPQDFDKIPPKKNNL